MKQRERFLAKLSAVCVLLLGTTATNFALAAKTAPASHHSDRASTGHRASTRHGEGKGPGTYNDGRGLQHGEVGSAAKSLRTEWGPIDTRITVLNGPRSRQSAKTHDWKKSNIARPLGTPRHNHQVWKRSGKERVVRNAIGSPVRQPNASRNAAVVRNAIGLPVGQPNASRNAPEIKVNGMAIGETPKDLNPRGKGVLGAAKKPINTQLTASINRSMINGTGMGRPGSGTVAIGGAKRNVAGVIDGTSFRPRH
jgi:hypothetical protein